MKRTRIYLGAMLCSFLLAAAPAQAVIQALLENVPSAGNGVIFGWAFSDVDPQATVTATLLIDGAVAMEGGEPVNIPCCGPRPDVQEEFSDAPLNTSFSLLINPRRFPNATSFGVRLSAPGEPDRNLELPVTVVVPGDVEDVKSFDLSMGGSAAVDGNEIVVAGAEVGGEEGDPITVNLRAAYETESDNIVIQDVFNGTDAELFNAVQAIFTARCAVPACHTGAVPQAAQDLSAGVAFSNIVAVRSVEDPTRPRVSPGSTEGSYLYQKVIENGDIAPGTVRMPQGCAGDTCLSDEEIQTIADWIMDGGRPAE